MRPVAVLALVLVLPNFSPACPWWGRCRSPRPVAVYPDCPPPVVYYYPPAEAVRVPGPKPVEPVREDVAPDGWCHIRGRVVYDGDPIPKQKPIPKSGGAYTEDWVVNPTNRGVQNVVVWLSPEPTAAQWERLKDRGPNRLREVPGFQGNQVYPGLSLKGERSIVHGHPVRAYVPHVLAAQAGSDVFLRNLSAVPDNPTWASRNNGEFSPLVPAGNVKEVKNLTAERFPINVSSNIYPWMKAYVWVFDHPYFAVTDPDGRFEIKFAPVGKLRLVAWQEDMGFRNGREGRFGEPIQVPRGRLELGEIKLKPNKE
jgi:hypothetical protein